MTVYRSYRFGNKHICVLNQTATLADMVNLGYDILYDRQYGANHPGSAEANDYGATWTTINTLIVFSSGGWMTLASAIEASNGASKQYPLQNAAIFVTRGQNGNDYGYTVGSEGSTHLTITKSGPNLQVVHLENTVVTVPVSVGWNAMKQLSIQSYKPTVTELQQAKANLRHVSPTEISDHSTMGNVGRVVWWPSWGASKMRDAAIRARQLAAED